MKAILAALEAKRIGKNEEEQRRPERQTRARGALLALALVAPFLCGVPRSSAEADSSYSAAGVSLSFPGWRRRAPDIPGVPIVLSIEPLDSARSGVLRVCDLEQRLPPARGLTQEVINQRMRDLGAETYAESLREGQEQVDSAQLITIDGVVVADLQSRGPPRGPSRRHDRIFGLVVGEQAYYYRLDCQIDGAESEVQRADTDSVVNSLRLAGSP